MQARVIRITASVGFRRVASGTFSIVTSWALCMIVARIVALLGFGGGRSCSGVRQRSLSTCHGHLRRSVAVSLDRDLQGCLVDPAQVCGRQLHVSRKEVL